MGNCCCRTKKHSEKKPPEGQKLPDIPKSPKSKGKNDTKVGKHAKGDSSRSRTCSISIGPTQTPPSPEPPPRGTCPRAVPSPTNLGQKLAPSANDAVVQLAAGAMGGLTAKEQQQVAKALNEEMDRRKRWKRLLRAKGCKRKKKPKSKGGKSASIEDVLARGLFDPSPTPLDTEMAAALEEAKSLDLKRQEWIRKVQEQCESYEPEETNKKAKKEKKKKKKKKKKRDVEQQPESLTIDADQAREVAAHANVMGMLDKLIADAAKQRSQGTMQKPEDTKKPSGPAVESSAPKQPADMTPDELIEFRRRDPDGWDAFTNANSVAAFALSQATTEDKARAMEIVKQKKNQREILPFDQKVSVTSVPAGDDFRKSEKKERTSAKLAFSPSPPKKK